MEVRMKKLAAVLATLAIPLFGCSSSVELKVPLDPQEYATCPGQGSNTITGSTFGHTKGGAIIDRKSTRLNSSHRCIPNAAFCLKKQARPRAPPRRRPAGCPHTPDIRGLSPRAVIFF